MTKQRLAMIQEFKNIFKYHHLTVETYLIRYDIDDISDINWDKFIKHVVQLETGFNSLSDYYVYDSDYICDSSDVPCEEKITAENLLQIDIDEYTNIFGDDMRFYDLEIPLEYDHLWQYYFSMYNLL